jgi:hypothetical protein
MSGPGRWGLAVQVSAQSWQELAAGQDRRYRVASTADGGIWLLRTPYPEPVAALSGSRRVVGHNVILKTQHPDDLFTRRSSRFTLRS